MEYEDRLRLRTPEGVDLDLVLAGMGSRMLAGLIDLTTQGLLALAYYLIVSAAGFDDAALSAAGWAIVVFLLLFGYDVGFEVLARGRTPGKRLVGLRVLRTGGEPIGLVSSALRNVVRIIDMTPGVYGIGVIVIFLTKRNQRLGDLVAGSVVVRERTGGHGGDQEATDLTQLVERNRQLAETVDVSAITQEEVLTVRRFLDRRHTLTPGAADQLALQLSQRLEPRVSGVPPYFPPERLLEVIVAAKAIRRGEAT